MEIGQDGGNSGLLYTSLLSHSLHPWMCVGSDVGKLWLELVGSLFGACAKKQ